MSIKTTELEVVGLRFRWTKEGRRMLAAMLDKRTIIAGLELVREPDNAHDSNAVKVMLPRSVFNGKQLGYLHREVGPGPVTTAATV